MGRIILITRRFIERNLVSSKNNFSGAPSCQCQVPKLVANG
jgi:hypothetical protein